MKIYHISNKKSNAIKLEPRIPQNFMTKHNFEDNKVKRVCVSKTIDGALKAMSMNLRDKELYVYSLDYPDNKIYSPTISEVPDVNITKELWIKEPVILNYEKTIKVGDAKNKDFNYTYGDNKKATLYGWNYKSSSSKSSSKMNKVAFLKEQIYKQASLDKVRKKQYWQILKRLYGGTDEAVSALKKSRDIGIYHGTSEAHIPGIASEGITAGGFREFGKGVFFGDKTTAGYYSKPTIVRTNEVDDFLKKSKKGNYFGGIHPGDINPDKATRKEMEDYIKKNPHYTALYGENLRLAKPDELKGTKIKYPNVNKAMVFDIDKKKGFRSVGRQLEYKTDTDSALRYRRMLSKKLKNVSEKEKENYLRKFYKDVAGYADDKINSEIELDKAYGIDRQVANAKTREMIYDRFTPKNDKEFHQMKYYGKSRRGRMFDGIISSKGKRNEFFFKQDKISPELLRRENGDFLPKPEIKQEAKPAPKISFSMKKKTKNIKPEIVAAPKQKTKNIKSEIVALPNAKPNASKIQANNKNNKRIAVGAGLAGAATGGYFLNKYLKKHREVNKNE